MLPPLLVSWPLLQVRRELASALRDIGSLLGPTAMLSFITQLTASRYQHLCNTHAAANPRCSSSNTNAVGSSRSSGGFLEPGLGLQGIAAGLAAGADVCGTTGGPRWGPAGSAAAAASHGAASAGGASVHLAHANAHVLPNPNLNLLSVAPAGAACASGCVPGDWLPLESGVYAAIVVLGKQRGEAAEQQVQQLVQYAAAAVSHPGGESVTLSSLSLLAVNCFVGFPRIISALLGGLTLIIMFVSLAESFAGLVVLVPFAACRLAQFNTAQPYSISRRPCSLASRPPTENAWVICFLLFTICVLLVPCAVRRLPQTCRHSSDVVGRPRSLASRSPSEPASSAASSNSSAAFAR
jgi:hypothetical protein